MIFFLSFSVGYFWLSYGQSTTPDIMLSTDVPPAESASAAVTPNAENQASFTDLLPVVVGLRATVSSTVELNFETIQPFLQQIENWLLPYPGAFRITVKNISRIAPN